jgi:hypothetical protein
MPLFMRLMTIYAFLGSVLILLPYLGWEPSELHVALCVEQRENIRIICLLV